MAKKNDLFEFNAPRYVDFTKDNIDEVDDSYFETRLQTPKPKKRVQKSPQVTEITEEVGEATEQPATSTEETEEPHVVTEEPRESLAEPPTAEATQEPVQPPTEHTETEQPLTEHEDDTEQPPTEHADKTEQPPTEHADKTEQPPTDHVDETEHIEQAPTEHSEEPGHPSQEEAATATAGEAQPATREKRRVSCKLSGVGVRQSSRLAAISKALRRRSAARCSFGNDQASSRTQDNQVKKVQPRKRAVRRVSGVSSITQEDEEDLETIATFRQKITNNKKKKDASGPSQPLRPTKPQEFHFATDQRLRKPQVEDPAPVPAILVSRPARTGPTKPQEFTFATDARLKVKEHIKGEEAGAPMEFARSLRSSTTTLNKDSSAGKGPTIPQPFNLSESRRPQAEEPKKFVAMAELNCKFYVQTPERFRSKRASSTEELEEKKKPRGVTVAHTPNLATGRRRRSLSLMTHEEREQQAFEEAQKHAFKAKPVNKKVLQTPSTGYRVEKKLPTKPEPFNITDTKTKKPQTPLLPESLTEEMGDAANLSVTSLPYGGLPLQGKRLTTKVQPFSFDSRDKATRMKKQEKIKKVLEEEKSLAEFHARPMPVFEDGVHGVPAKKPPTPTQVKPFALHVEQRGSLKQERFKQQLEEEAQADAARRKFLAQSDHVVHKMPFVPEKSNKPLTEISNITLNTEVRAADRSEYDHQCKMLEEEMVAAKKMEEERREAEELAEVARLRQAAVHKAQPVLKTKPMVIQPAPQLPTVPKSPNFATESRLRSRLQANSTFSL